MSTYPADDAKLVRVRPARGRLPLLLKMTPAGRAAFKEHVSALEYERIHGTNLH